MMPWKEATRPNSPSHTSICSQPLPLPTTVFIAWGSGSLILDSARQSPTPPAKTITPIASTVSVRMPPPRARGMVRCGSWPLRPPWRPLNGEEEPDGERNGGEHPRQRQAAEAVRARPAVSGEVAPGEAGGDHAHEHQQLEDGQQGDDQLEGGGDADAENIERHKDHVGAAGEPISDPAPETAR